MLCVEKRKQRHKRCEVLGGTRLMIRDSAVRFMAAELDVWVKLNCRPMQHPTGERIAGVAALYSCQVGRVTWSLCDLPLSCTMCSIHRTGPLWVLQLIQSGSGVISTLLTRQLRTLQSREAGQRDKTGSKVVQSKL